MNRLVAIEQSLRAFRLSLWGLIPLLGLVSSVRALLLRRRIRRMFQDWNPADSYLCWSVIFGVFGLFQSILGAGLVALAIADALLH